MPTSLKASKIAGCHAYCFLKVGCTYVVRSLNYYGSRMNIQYVLVDVFYIVCRQGPA
jgi:hypothetical protein